MANLQLKEHHVTIAEAAVLIKLYTDAGSKPMIWGGPGLGKSDIVKQLGALTGRPVIEFHAALRETVDLRGIPVPDLTTGTTRWLRPDELPNAERDGAEGYLFLDEFNQANPQMQSALAGLVLYGTIGEYRLPKGWRIIAAGNRISDRASAQRMPTHVRDRFVHIYVEADLNAWTDWATKNSIAPELVAFLRLRPDHLHVMPQGDENAFPTPRSWAEASKFVTAPKAHRLRLFAGIVGDAYASEFDGFIDLYRSIGTLEDIIKNPKTAPVPTEASIRFATVTGLARLATKKNLDAIVEYAKRLNHRESEMLVMHDATVRDEDLKNTAAYGNWAVKQQGLTIQ